MSVGVELAAARARQGLSLEELSKRTKISVERLAAIEQEDLLHLPPLVYLKGFVREYATAIHLDPDEMTRRYLSELDDPASLVSAGLFESESALPESIPATSNVDDGFALRDRLTVPSRSFLGVDDVPPLHEEPFVRPPVPRSPRVARMAIVGLLAAAAGYLVSANLGTWFPGTSGSPPASVAATRANAPEKAARAAGGTEQAESAVAARSAGEQTTDRAVDTNRDRAPAARAGDTTADPGASDRGAAATDAIPPHSQSAVPAAPPQASSPRGLPKPGPATGPPTSPTRAAPAVSERTERPATPIPSTPGALPPSTPSPAPRASTASPTALTGWWSLTTRVEITDHEAFNDLNLGYRLQLTETGDRITGRGTKWMENGKPIPPRSRTPIIIEGVRKGNRLELRFTEHGTRRTTGGTFVMDVSEDGTLRGQFASSAANSGGSSIARRITAQP
jgi:transcriptional regulator with XRE-family HTH domain